MNPKTPKPLSAKELELIVRTSGDDLQKAFPGRPRAWLRQQKREASKHVKPEALIAVDVARARAKAELKDRDLRYRTALAQATENQKALDAALALAKAQRPGTTYKIAAKGGRHEATAIAMASDWHSEEPVSAAKTNDLNAFDLDEFEARACRFFTNLVRLVRKEGAAVDIRNLVLWLGGDFITGSLHDDTTQANQLGPVDAITNVQRVIAKGIETLLSALPDVQLTIPCSAGNHSRMTHKQMIKSEQENSLETLMYRSLAQIFAKEPRVKFILPQGYHTYLDVHGKVLRFHHGHNIKYGGGVGGITIPVNKAIAQWNKSRVADLDIFGHFHQRMDGGNFLANGSLIGFNEFALAIKAGYEPPQQQFALIDSKHGKTVVAPILLTED